MITLSCTSERKSEYKKCQHIGCETKVYTKAKNFKYCDEHKKKYIKKKSYTKKVEISDDNNEVIKHNYFIATKISKKCALENCNEEFEITINPHTYTYPKYCIKHRSEYKRNLFLKNNSE